jgi:hypothetical protein
MLRPVGVAKKAGVRGKRGLAPSKGSITVKDLIARELIAAGSVVKITHRGESGEGILQADGSITAGEEIYPSCTDFATLHDYRDEILES